MGIALLFVLLVACTTPESEATTISSTATLAPLTQTQKPPAATVGPKPSSTGTLEQGQITSQALANNRLGDPAKRDFRVYLPPSYNTSDKRYPVVYALHNFYGDENDMIPMSRELDRLVASGEVQEMIIVFVNGENKFGGSHYLSSPTIGDYESYIVREMVAHIDANYRTIPVRDSRGITGCSMGGEGAIRLAFKYPDVLSVAVPMSGIYNFEDYPEWEPARDLFQRTPEDFDDFARIPWQIHVLIAYAAGAAPNSNKPPFYLDMPFENMNGEVQIVPEVWEKVNAVDPVHAVRQYLNQPLRLRGLMIYHGEYDQYHPVDLARNFDKMLTELGVEHEYLESNRSYCNLDFTPLLQFMSDHLTF
jgi:enterochelin esterase-like enzyme